MTDSAGYASAYPSCAISIGDFNGDGSVTAGDIASFTAAVTAGGAAARSFAYDEENRLLTVHEGNDLLLEIAYDALGRRVVTVDHDEVEDPCDEPTAPPYQEVQTRHVYLGLTPIEEHRRAFCDVNPDVPWGLAREYLWGENFPEPLALIDWTEAGDVAAGNEEWLYYLRDVLGNVVGLATPEDQQASGAQSELVERYVYDPYGKTYIETWIAGTSSWDRVSASRFGNPFMWTGQRYDPGVQLYHFLFRTYSPELGRWHQRDPLGYVDGLSLYLYGRAIPLRFVDPFGLDVKIHINKTGSSDSSSSNFGHAWVEVTNDDTGETEELNVWPDDNRDLTYEGQNGNTDPAEGDIVVVIETTSEEEQRGIEAIKKRKKEIDDGEKYKVIGNSCVSNTIGVCEKVFDKELDDPWWPEKVDDELKEKLPDRKCSERKGNKGSGGGSSS